MIVSCSSLLVAMSAPSAGYVADQKERKFLMFKSKYDPDKQVDAEFKEHADGLSKSEVKDEIQKTHAILENVLLKLDYLKSISEDDDDNEPERFLVKVGHLTNDPTKLQDLNVSATDSLATLKGDIARLFKVPKMQIKNLNLVMNGAPIDKHGKTSIKKANIVENAVVILQ